MMIADKLITEIGTPVVAYLRIKRPGLADEVWELIEGGPLGRASLEALAMYRAILAMANCTITMAGETNVIDLVANTIVI